MFLKKIGFPVAPLRMILDVVVDHRMEIRSRHLCPNPNRCITSRR